MSNARSADPQVISVGPDVGASEGSWKRSDVLGLVVVAIAGVLVLVPTLVHGTFFGPYDILQSTGLNKVPNVKPHNPTQFDQISLFIPWTNQVWTDVHQGHLPLWNPYNALGMPLAFNWESAPLSLPSLVGYLFPVRLAYTVQVLVTMVVAGAGVYVLGKVLRLGVLGCMTAAVAFELCGPFMANLGWPLASVWSWGGWIFAAILLVLRGKKRAQVIVFLALVTAFAVYAGNPEDDVLLTLSAGVFVLAMLLFRLPVLGGEGALRRPLVDVGIAAIAGVALAAPLVLPGSQLGGGSNRTAVGADLFPKGLPPKDLFHLVFQGFDGLPVLHSQWFGLSVYPATSAYVGPIVLVLAGAGFVLRWKRPEVRSFAVLAFVTGLLVFAPPLVSLLDKSVVSIYWIFALTPMILAIAVLAGFGMDAMVKSHGEQRVRRVLGVGFAGMAALLGIVWLVGRRGLTPSQGSIRAHSFIWPTIEVIAGLLVVWLLVMVARRKWSRLSPSAVGILAGSLLFAVATGFLITAGAPLLTSSSEYPTSTPAVASLQQAVGDSIVAVGGTPTYPSDLGIMVNANILYGVHEFGAYDPLVPRGYFSLHGVPISALASFGDIFSPGITNVRAARLYGIGYLLEPSGVAGPKGTDFVRKVGNEDLYRVPGAAAATLVAVPQNGSSPGIYASGTSVPVTKPNPGTWHMVTHGETQSTLRLRLTNVPGWRATIDGKPVDITSFAGVMQQIRVPPGHHVIEVRYWPKTLSLGIVLAACSALGLAILLVLGFVRSRASATPKEAA